MKLLIVTQVVDSEHSILGFFLGWITEFAKHCEHVHVICLQAGQYDLPDNVTVHSLGKEADSGRLLYLWRFYKLIWKLRKEYDSVFVHMNQIYIILGAPLWRLWGKRVGLWYMHGTVSNSLKIAEKLTHKIFTGSSESCRLDSEKIIVTGHGINTENFSPDPSIAKTLDLITVGRITPSKNLLELIDILVDLRKTNDVSLTIVGEPVTESEKEYKQKLATHIESNRCEKYVHFAGRVPQAELPRLLNQARIFVTVAQNGSLDKAVLEAMACGLPVASMAPGTISLGLDVGQVSGRLAFVERVVMIMTSEVFRAVENISCVRTNHSIVVLIKEKILIALYGGR